jgi:hypothetical protein
LRKGIIQPQYSRLCNSGSGEENHKPGKDTLKKDTSCIFANSGQFSLILCKGKTAF